VENTPQNFTETQGLAKGLVASDVAIKKKAFLRYVVGSIKNTSTHRFSYLIVKIDLFEENGKLVANVQSGIENFERDQTWDFEAGILNDEAVAARVSEIRGWL
jgi:hypothetical protein